MKFERDPQRFCGQVKYNQRLGGGESCLKYRAGSILLTQRDHDWKLEVFLDVKSENAALTVFLTPESIITCMCTEFLLIKSYHPPRTKDTVTVHFKPDNKSVLKALKELSLDVKGRVSHTPVPGIRSEVGLSSSSIVTTPSRKTLFSSIGNTSENVRAEGKTENRYAESPQRFTSVKENVRYDFDDIDGDFKENIVSTPNRQASEKFLQRGLERSRQNLSALGAKTFYSGSTPQQNNYNGSGGWLSSVKRQPGLMPDPTPSKKPRLSNSIPYSMKARTASEDQKQQPALQGFSNLGNTCYMNAILQSLFGLDTLAADILITNRKLLKTVSPQSLYYALAKLLNSRKQNLTDVSRRDLLRKVKGAISASAKRFSGYGQHDAHEFLGQVLDQLKEEVVKISKSTPSPVREHMEENGDSELDYINPTTVNFEFEVMHTIRCLQCQEEVSKVEQFHDVSVDLPKRKDINTPRSLQDSLSIFFRKEDIEYTCEKCGHNKSEVTHKFTRLPRKVTRHSKTSQTTFEATAYTYTYGRAPDKRGVFIIHLKRYSYDHTYLRNTKMAQSVKIPSYLTLESHCEESTQPAHPVELQHVSHSKEKALTIFDTHNTKEETPKRKLDFPGYKFNKKGLTPSTTANGTNSTGPETGNQEKEKEEARLLKPLTLEDEEDSELAKAIEMSLKEQEEREQFSRDYGDDTEGNFQKVLEMSRNEEKHEQKPSTKDLDNLSEEQLIQLAIEQSLMETDPYHHANYSYNDDVIKTAGDHDYAESYDIGPDRPSKCPKTMHDGQTSQNKMNNSNTSSGIYSSARTTETDDIIKSCSKAVMSSSFNQAASPGLFSDSDSDGLELFHDSDGSQKLTKLEDRTRVKVENRNNNFTNDISDTTSKYFNKGGTDNKLVLDTNRENTTRDGHENFCVKLPGGKKETKSSRRKQSRGYNESCNDGSSDTDDFELTIETESEYKRSTTSWCNNSLKSYDKLNHKKTTKEELPSEDHVHSASEATIKVKNESHTGLNENTTDLNDKVETDRVTSGKGFSDDIIELGSDDSSNNCASGDIGSSKESARKCNSSGQYVRKCQLGVKDKIEDGTCGLKTDKTADDFDKDNTKSETDEVWNDIMKDDSAKVVKTPNRRHYGQRLEDIGRKMTLNSKTGSESLKENGSHGANLLEEIDKNSDGGVEIVTGRGAAVETDRTHFEDKAVTDFQCNEDDSWIHSIDDKENKQPSKQRPMLTDPSDVFRDSNTLTDDKTANPDEVDSYIEESLDIPEINNEKGDLPYSYQLVSVVSHMGISSSTGHYISDVYDLKKRGWFSFDDSHVSKTTESEVRSKRERSGYIFFYMSKDIVDDLCLHHAVTTTDRKKES